jgi:hypothetical protein
MTPSSDYFATLAATQKSRWVIDKSTNALDGKAHITVSDENIVIRCAPKVEGYLKPNLPNLGGQLSTNADYGQTVRYKLDDGRVQQEWWSISTSFDDLFFPHSVINALPKASKLIVEYKPEYVTPMTGTYDLTGLSEALSEAGCHLGSSQQVKSARRAKTDTDTNASPAPLTPSDTTIQSYIPSVPPGGSR